MCHARPLNKTLSLYWTIIQVLRQQGSVLFPHGAFCVCPNPGCPCPCRRCWSSSYFHHVVSLDELDSDGDSAPDLESILDELPDLADASYSEQESSDTDQSDLSSVPDLESVSWVIPDQE
jgi:hypothetical protein